jgi:tol-pal system protein YbgF
MYSANCKILRVSVIYILIGVGLSACASTAQNVPVQNVPASQSPVASSPQGVQSVNQLNALQAEIRELRNQLEEQQFEVENLKQRQQDLFQGLDHRLRVTETMQRGGNVIAPDGTITTPGMLPPLGAELPLSTQEPPVMPGDGAQTGQVSTVVVTPPPPVPVASVAGADQQALYDQGFDYLKRSQYTEAIGLFTQLVSQFPNGGLADDASYWVGEANYVNRQYEAAIKSFRKVVAQYPQSDRVPEALLKVGYVQYDIGDYQNAKTTFQDVLRRYPDHPVSISAKSRLQRIDQGLSG